MDKTAIVRDKDRYMLTAFSRRVLKRVTGRSLRSLHLPFMGAYLEANVMKEIAKDGIVIRHAGDAFAAAIASGTRSADPDLEAIFEATKAVDRTFVKNLAIPAISVMVRYEDIADIRKKRIRMLYQGVYDLLGKWEDASPFEDAVRTAFPEARFRETLTGILHLYDLETRTLSRSIRLFPPFNAAVHLFADSLYDIMESVSLDLVEKWSMRIYGGKRVHAAA